MMKTTTKRHLVSALAAVCLLAGGSVFAQQHEGPRVGGAVFGGGRMANVSGTTTVTVNNADSLGAVYGGNDVSGTCGAATITIGTAQTSASATGPDGEALSKGIRIGSVYGGGNGYYDYGSNDGWPTLPDGASGSSNPKLPSTKITVVSNSAALNLVQIDSLFGGAKAADVTSTSGNPVDIEINGGRMIAVFGGNNYGGSIAGISNADGSPTSSATLKITVNNTQVDDSRPNYDHGNGTTEYLRFGREYGIRYLFGGGNKVKAPNVQITLKGGMIDTAFAGGNSATVLATTVTTGYTDATAYDYKESAKQTAGHDEWVGGKYSYNVHTLFGGNNAADMAILPTLSLSDGSFGTVYGGGNAGNMTGSQTKDGLAVGSQVELPSGSEAHVDYLYGGCQVANVSYSTLVSLSGGYVGTVYGGCNVSGDVGSSNGGGSYVQINDGATVYCDVFGGANGYYHCNDEVHYLSDDSFEDNDGNDFDYYGAYVGKMIPTHNLTSVSINGGTIYGNVYAGANMASVGFGSNYSSLPSGVSVNAGSASLKMTAGEVQGNVFGGGNMASIYGLSSTQVSGGKIGGALYAGNDKMGTVQAFGAYPEGSDMASNNSDPLNDGNSAKYSSYVKVTGSANVNQVFGGGNGAYYYGDEESEKYRKDGEDPIKVCSMGGIGQKPLQKSAYVDINLTDEAGKVDEVFGGGNGVSVTDGVTVLLNSPNGTVGSIFGGNNQCTMENIVPEIKLEKGTVAYVYGGGNAGNMEGSEMKKDQCGSEVGPVSTYVLLDNNSVTVTGAIYGGCKNADLENMAYVVVRGGKAEQVFGGNDLGGLVEETRVDVEAGTVAEVYGGSNGYYTYSTTDGTVYTVTTDADGNTVSEDGIKVKNLPVVEKTTVNVMGGAITKSVFGGGLYGDCGETHMLVGKPEGCTSDFGSLTISGEVFGGGAGNFTNLCAERKGNVNGTAYVDLRDGAGLSGATIYGGGKGGDVQNTELTVHNTFSSTLEALYGGCWGSDVLGNSHVTIDGNATIGMLFGGNDVSGNVVRATVDINKGTFDNIYGAGNGDYTYPYSGAEQAPNAEDIEINIAQNDNITVTGNLYGGGRMGTTFKTAKTDGHFTRNDACELVPDTACSATEVSHIVLNIHGGNYRQDIYAGGAGAEGGNQITYAVKQINMDGGTVAQSIYGGTQNVDDGFGHNCSQNAGDMLPSSILNLTGGTFKANVYGGGFLGNIYGATYVNIGVKAVETSPVWSTTYRIAGVMDNYKPTFTDAEANNYLAAHALSMESSVFGGANWGEAGENANFDAARGYYGGESRILIDGLGYDGSGQPSMDITKSVICAGTSTKGGDLGSDITIRNYGTMNGCNGATKQIESVQRAAHLTLENTALLYTGAVDATSAYSATPYSINNIEQMVCKGFNNLSVEKPIDNIGSLTFQDASGNVISTPMTAESECTVCDELTYGTAYTTLYMLNGTYARVKRGDVYGPVNGFGFVVTDDGFRAQFFASTSTTGGYVSPCSANNDYTDHQQIGFNDNNGYRFWQLGEGSSAVSQEVNAFSNVSAHSDINRLIVGTRCDNSNTEHLALAKATLYLPATTESGHYYKFKSGILVDNSKGVMKLIEAGWRPNGNFSDLPDSEWSTDADNVTRVQTNADGITCADDAKIQESPDDRFGMVLVPSEGFNGNTAIAISANANFSTAGSYTFPAVSNPGMPQIDVYLTYNNQFAKTLVGDVTFTLEEFNDNDESVGDVNVTLTVNTIIDGFQGTNLDLLAMYNEGVSNKYERKRLIPATLQSRKLYLSSVRWEPTSRATLAGAGTKARGDRSVADSLSADPGLFILTKDGSFANTTNKFAIKANLNEDLTNNLTAINGWYTNGGSSYDVFEVAAQRRSALGTEASTTRHSATVDGVATEVDTVLFSKIPSYYVFDENGNNTGDYQTGHSNADYNTDVDSERGYFLGTLDGRASAAIDYELDFDGSMVFHTGFVGRVIMDYAYYKGNNFLGRFYDTLYVRCREHGDTIFMASADSVTRSCEGESDVTLKASSAYATNVLAKDMGKRPNLYLQYFDTAFSNDAIYQEGDVFAIIGTMEIGSSTVMRGIDMTRIPIIRYAGHHSDLPGECGTFRGPMFHVSGSNTRFSAYNVTFDGSSVGRKWETGAASPTAYTLDTTAADEPIFVVDNGATLALASGSVVRNNYNRSTTTPGAIYLDGGSTLILNNGVTIENNLNAAGDATTAEPLYGAVQAAKGMVELGTSKEGALVVDKNYLVGSGEYFTTAQVNYGATTENRYVINTDVVSTWPQANVFLGREDSPVALCEEAGSTVDGLKDNYNSMVRFSSELPDGTHIGISKQYPAPLYRDTVSVVMADLTNSGFIAKALGTLDEGQDYNNDGQLFNDNDVRQFTYLASAPLSGKRFYYHSCTPFRNQADALACEDAVLTYTVDPNGGGCPTDNLNDVMTYRVRGGFAPYTFTWNGDKVTDANITLTDNTYYTAADSRFAVPAADMQMGYNRSTSKTYTATAADALGCETSKTVTVNFIKSSAAPGVRSSEGAEGVYAAEAKIADADAANTGTFDRNFQGMKVETAVWPDEAAGSISATVGEETLNLDETYFCDGEEITLNATSTAGHSFIMWDVDPYDNATLPYVVNRWDNKVTAYFGPQTHWHEYINSTTAAGASYDDTYYANGNRANYVTTYNGDVHIYNEDGLAWFISVVNGLNGVQSREFYFNRVFLHQKEDGTEYDMGAYLWTPVGRQQHPFRGRFIGVGSTTNDTTHLTGSRVVVKNIIVNEPNLNYVGFFGFLDSAKVTGIELSRSLFYGAQYVGGLAAKAVRGTRIDNCAVTDSTNDFSTSTILTTHYTSGGMVAWTEDSTTITSSSTHAKYMGDAVYSGGIVGIGSGKVNNNYARNLVRMEAVYQGGIVGRFDGGDTNYTPASFFRRTKSVVEPSVVANNYVYTTSDGRNHHMGGIVGRAANTRIENNYVFGTVDATLRDGGIAAELHDGARASHNYVESDAAKQMAGATYGTAQVATAATFAGEGNHVDVSQPVYGVNNLTRVLNLWVREHNASGDSYATWRSDLEGTNQGYPVFGEPDLIPVADSAELLVCDSVEIDGVVYTADTVVVTSVADSLMMVDSTTTLTLTVHHSVLERYADSVTLGQVYDGYGFTVDAAAAELLRSTVETYGSATLVLSDTLATEFGCDSVVVLTLTYTQNTGIAEVGTASILVYPNPTVSTATVRADGLRYVELYDNDGRRMATTRQVDNGTTAVVDVAPYASGVYYLRVHTASGVTIQKLIKK